MEKDVIYVCDFVRDKVFECKIRRECQNKYIVSRKEENAEIIMNVPKSHIFSTEKEARKTINDFLEMKGKLCSRLIGFDYESLRRDIKFLCWFETALCFNLSKDWISSVVIEKMTNGDYCISVCDSRVGDDFYIANTILKKDFSDMDEVLNALVDKIDHLSPDFIKSSKKFFEDLKKWGGE